MFLFNFFPIFDLLGHHWKRNNWRHCTDKVAALQSLFQLVGSNQRKHGAGPACGESAQCQSADEPTEPRIDRVEPRRLRMRFA